jgi:hypothetical protein
VTTLHENGDLLSDGSMHRESTYHLPSMPSPLTCAP